MNETLNSIANNALASLTQRAGPVVSHAIKAAANKTGVDFGYLLQQAKAESSFNPQAKAKTSSASGLFQFLESTWMDMVDRHGDKHGIDKTAAREDILALRDNPRVASIMAAEFASDNARALQRDWGGSIGATERYFAHFLGASGAASFLKARDQGGHMNAAAIFPHAAKANEAVFFDQGRARSLDEVYAFFDQKFQVAPAVEESPAPTRLANGQAYTPAAPAQSYHRIEPAMLMQHSYNALVMNQMDLILLTQALDLPLMGEG